MFVVDNGRTLDVDDLTSEQISVIPNDNVGGSGGFARGMIAAKQWGATHVLLMDDDVEVFPESFKRCFNLLALANDKYKDAFINGAMLSLENPSMFFEDVSYVADTGCYRRIKSDMDISQIGQCVKCETIDVEVKNAYGAWWFSCIPMDAVDKNGLPLPMFVRCDDVEFGMRNQPVYMCMNGICVWHAPFDGRYRANVDCYQYTRNFLMMMAIDDLDLWKFFMLRFWREFNVNLRAMNYSACDLMLDGLEDYLKGPDFIKTASGEELMKSKGSKNEKLVAIEDLDRDLISKTRIDYSNLHPRTNHTRFSLLLETLPHDRHMLPDFLLSDDPAPTYYWYAAWPAGKTMRKKTLIALDASGKNGVVRNMDRVKYRNLRRRYKQLMAKYKRQGANIAQAYRSEKRYLTSEDFWNEYLGLN
jgi:hypothetical protein